MVVFKTRERHPVRRAARTVGTPVRAVKTTVYTVIGKIAGWLTFWKPKKKTSAEVPAATRASVRTAPSAAMAAPDYLPIARMPRPKQKPPAPAASPPETEWAETGVEAGSEANSTETLHWADPVEPALYGQNVQPNQTGG